MEESRDLPEVRCKLLLLKLSLILSTVSSHLLFLVHHTLLLVDRGTESLLLHTSLLLLEFDALTISIHLVYELVRELLMTPM